MSFTETVTRIRDEKLSFARFGDGELKNMLRSGYQLRFQPSSKELSSELMNVFTDEQNVKCLIGFPTLYRDLHWSRVWIDIWPDIRKLIPEDRIFGNAHVTRPIFFQNLDTSGVELWRSVWEDRHVVLITGKDSRMTLVPELFDNVATLECIHSKPVDAFSDLPRILDEIQKYQKNNNIFLIALGPAGTVLTHRISALQEQAIDIGHISDSYQTVFQDAAWPESKPLTQ